MAEYMLQIRVGIYCGHDFGSMCLVCTKSHILNNKNAKIIVYIFLITLHFPGYWLSD